MYTWFDGEEEKVGFAADALEKGEDHGPWAEAI